MAPKTKEKRAAPNKDAQQPNDESAQPVKKPKTEPESNAPMVPLAEPRVNTEYLSFVAKDLAIITEQWPDIRGQKPLPLSGTTGYLSFVGYGAPFDSAAYNEQYPQDTFQYSCSINFMWQDFLASVLHYVPLYWDRVVEYAKDQVRAPGLLRYTSYV